MATPTLTVEFGFRKTPDTRDYYWNDISAYVVNSNWGRGVSRELSDYSAGQATVVVKNFNREFDPTHTSPATVRTNLVKNPIPSTATAVSPQENWAIVNRGTGGAGTTVLTANGAFDTVTTAASTVNYSFAVTGGSTAQRIEVVAGVTYTIGLSVKSSIADIRRLGATFYDSTGASLGEFTVGNNFTLPINTEVRMTGTVTAPANAVSMRFYGGSTTGSVIRTLNSTMTWRWASVEAGTTSGTFFSGNSIGTGQIAYAWTGDAQASLSTETTYPSLFGNDVKPAGAIRIKTNGYTEFFGLIDSWEFEYPNDNFTGYATITAYDGLSALAKAELDTTVNLTGYTGSRIQAILNNPAVQWNTSLQQIDAGSNIIQGDTISQGTTALSYIQQVARSEPGDIFADRTGAIVFKDRKWLDQDWVSGATIQNLCKNPSFESGLAYWKGGNGSPNISLTANQRLYGTKSLQANYNPVVGSVFAQYVSTTETFTAGTNYRITAYVFVSSVTNVSVSMTASVGDSNPTTSATLSLGDGWARLSTAVNSTYTTNQISLTFSCSTSSVSLFIDGVMINAGLTTNDYFDGSVIPASTSSTTRYLVSWDGSANGSTSTRTTQTLTTNPTPSPIAVTDSSGSGIPYQDIKISYNSENLYNRIMLTRVSSTVITQEDTSLQAVYGVRALSIDDLLNNTDADVTTMAYDLLTNYSKPELRAESLTIELQGLNSADQNTILQADVRDVVQITFKPTHTGVAKVGLYNLIGVSHNAQSKAYTVTWNVASLANQPFRLDSSVTGVLDQNILGYPS